MGRRGSNSSDTSLPAEVAAVESELVVIEEQLASVRKRLKRFAYWLMPITLMPILIVVLDDYIAVPYSKISGLMLLPIVFAAFPQLRLQFQKQELEEKREKLIARTRIGAILGARSSVGEASKPSARSYFDSLVRINVENLGDYYELVRHHTNNSYRASLIVAVIGFLLICTGLVATSLSNHGVGKIAAGAGIITEFISAIFFYLYNRNVSQLKDYHDSLLAVQNVLLSFKLVDDATDGDSKRQMTERMCEFLLVRYSTRETFDVSHTGRVKAPIARPAQSGSPRKKDRPAVPEEAVPAN